VSERGCHVTCVVPHTEASYRRSRPPPPPALAPRLACVRHGLTHCRVAARVYRAAFAPRPGQKWWRVPLAAPLWSLARRTILAVRGVSIADAAPVAGHPHQGEQHGRAVTQGPDRRRARGLCQRHRQLDDGMPQPLGMEHQLGRRRPSGQDRLSPCQRTGRARRRAAERARGATSVGHGCRLARWNRSCLQGPRRRCLVQ